VARLAEAPGTYHLGFVLGPRVNAGGRVGEADLGTRLLTTTDPAEAREIAQRLDALNRERQAIEQSVLAEAIAQVEAAGDRNGFVLAAGDGWHPGVIGIVAARLAERFQRPSAVVALDGDRGKGSGRSAPGFDLGAAIIAARLDGLLVDGGGHRQAAGFTVLRGQLDGLARFLSSRLAEHWQRPKPTTQVDGVLGARGVSIDLVALLERAGPFGAGQPSPNFVVADVRVIHADVVGQGHVRAVLVDQAGVRLPVIAFRAAETPLGAALRDRAAPPLHVLGTLRADSWNGRRRVQFDLRDAAYAPTG